MKYFFNFLILSLLFNQCEAQHLKLSLNLKKGNTYYILGTSNTAITQTINGQENNTNLGLSYKMAFKVISVIDSVYNMEVSYQTLNMKIKVADKTIELDSRKSDKQNITSAAIAAMMNKPFNIVMTKSGKIRSIANVEKMISGTLENFPQVDAAKKGQIKSQLLQTFGESTLKGNLEMETAIFPEREVVKNNKWTVNTTLESTGKENVHTIYQLMDINGSFYQIHGMGTIVTDRSAKPGQINGMPVKYYISGTSVSDIKADKITGWVREVKLKRIMKGNVEIMDNPKVPGGLKFPMSFNMEATTTDK